MANLKKNLKPIYPGEILMEEFMKPVNLSTDKVAQKIMVSPNRISDIVNGKSAISADTALRLGKAFGVSPELWQGLQADYEMRLQRRG